MAGSSAGEVSLSVKADTAGIGQKIKDGVEGETGKTDFSGVGRIIGGALAVGVGLALAGLGAVIKTGLDETLQASAGMAQLEAGIKSTGNAANVSVQGMTNLATSLQNMSGQTDDSIIQAQNLLLTFTNIRNMGPDKIFDDATLAATNMAAKLGGDASSQAMMLGKALNDPTQGLLALRRAGVSFSDSQIETIKAMQASGDIMGAQKMILAELSKEFGGAAEAAGKSLPGQLNILKRNFEDMAQTVVGGLLPSLTPLFPILQDAIKQVMPPLADLVKQIGPLLGDAIKMVVPIIVDLVKQLGPIMGPILQALMPVLKVIGDLFKAIVPAIMPLIETVGQMLVPILQILTPIIQLLTPIIVLIIQIALVPLQIAFDLISKALKWLWDLIGPFVQSMADGFTKMMADSEGPMGFIQDGIKAIGDIFTWLYENIIKPVVDAISVAFQWWQDNVIAPLVKYVQMNIKIMGEVFTWLYENIIKPVFDSIGAAFDWIWNTVIKPVVDFINAAIKTVGDTVNAVFGGIGDFIGSIFTNIQNIFRGAINGIIDFVNGAIDVINPLLDGPVGDAARGMGIDIRHINHVRHLAEGGVVMPQPGGVLARIAEAGQAEAVIPLDKLDQVMSGKGGGPTVNYYAAPNNSLDAEQDLFAAMRRSKLLVGW